MGCRGENQADGALRSKEMKREVEEWLKQVESIKTKVALLRTRVEESQGFIKWLMNGREATQLNEKVHKLHGQTSHFGELVVDICGIRGQKMLTTRMVGEAFEINFVEIWNLLESKKVSSIGVRGGGVGKPSLAKGIYNKLQETYGEGSVFWVTVSREFTIKSLQETISRLLGVNLSDMDELMRAGRVYRALSEMKNAILILDDVWKYIDLLKVGVPLSVECCRLILTTPFLKVCHWIGCKEVIEVHKLGEDEAWNLFHETFTVNGREMGLDHQVEAIAKSVTEMCDGVALEIVSMAGNMRGQTSLHAWRNELKMRKGLKHHNKIHEVTASAF